MDVFYVAVLSGLVTYVCKASYYMYANSNVHHYTIHPFKAISCLE